MSTDCDGLFDRHVDIGNDQSLVISQRETGDEGAVVWDAALVLCAYLRHLDTNTKPDWKSKSALELGAGTGVCGLQMSALGVNCTITDLERCLPLIRHNIKQNTDLLKGTTTCAELKWGSTEFHGGFDYVVMADCIYYEECLSDLINTMLMLCEERTQILCCYEQRETKTAIENKFIRMATDVFEYEVIPTDAQDALFSCDEIKLYKFYKK